jgi:RNA polymerase sigma factor (TIGR02999 family)
MTSSRDDVTRLLQAARGGEHGASEALAERVYFELRQMAERLMGHEAPGNTLQPTALVSEAWLTLTGSDFSSRREFFGAAAQAMRRLLVDAARRRHAEKRGGGRKRITFQDVAAKTAEPDVDLLALDDALGELEAFDPRLAETVRLRYFTGLTIPQVAELLDVSPATVKRDWTYARAWLFARMGEGQGDDTKNGSQRAPVPQPDPETDRGAE